MAKLVEGDRIFTAAAAATAGSGNINELQDQLIKIVEARHRMLWPQGREIGGGTAWQLNSAEVYLGNSTSAANQFVVGLPLYVGQKITEVEVRVSGTSGQTGGNIDLYYGPRDTKSDNQVVVKAGPNPWDTGGVGTLVTATKSGLAIIVLADYAYYLRFKPATNVVGNENRIYDYRVEAQFGN